LPNSKPINRIDQAAYKHDLAYKSENLEDRHNADKIMIQELKNIQNPTFRERVERALIIKILQAKLKLGAGLTKEQRNKMTKEELEQWAITVNANL